MKLKQNIMALGLIMMAFSNIIASLVPLTQADYIIVVNSTLRNSTWENNLVSLKEAQGLTVGLLSVADANFSNLPACYSQKRIRDTLKSVYFSGSKRLKYVLLVGDANIFAAHLMHQYQTGVGEKKNYASSKYLNFIPGPSRKCANSDRVKLSDILAIMPANPDTSWQGWANEQTANEDSMITSDDFYGNYEGDSILTFTYDNSLLEDEQPHIIPEAIVGRAPVRTITEMANFVAKLQQYANNLTTTGTAVTAMQKNILGLIDDHPHNTNPPDHIRYPFDYVFPSLIPGGVTLNKVYYEGTPNIFNRNGSKYLLSLYSSVTGPEGELYLSFFRYRDKYNADARFRTHDRTGNPATSDDDIDDCPAITDGSNTILLMDICDRLDFDGVEYSDRQKIKALIDRSATYYDGYFTNGNDLIEDVLLTPNRGAVAVIGARFNTALGESTAFYKRFLNAVYTGESVLGQAFRSAKLYADAHYNRNRSRNVGSTPLGDRMILGDPAMVVNIPNQGATFGNPASLSIVSDSGCLKASWPSVSGATGYSVAIADSLGIPIWTSKTTSTTYKATILGVPLRNEQQYYLTVRPYILQGTAPATVPCFARNAGITGSARLDAFVNPPVFASANAETNGTVTISITASPDADIKGYKVYRVREDGYSCTLVSVPYTTSLSFSDTPPVGQDCYYKVTALDTANNESTPVQNGIVHSTP